MADAPLREPGWNPAARWARVSAILSQVLDLPDAKREAFLAEAIAREPALRTDILALYEDVRRTDDSLEPPSGVAEAAAFLAAYREAGSLGQALTVPSTEQAPRLAPGDALGPYRIEALIGSGGMGEVYRAHDTRLDRDVAVKVLPLHVAGDTRLKRRLEREARALATLSHPHICPVYDVGEHEGVDYLVMEYLEGETLARRLTRGALPLGEALRRAVEIADALDKAHRGGVVHRDLKPGNVMLTKGGARLLDFGIAKLRPASDRIAGPGADLTGHGMVLGTLQYMAPEQLSGQEADARTDIFAFGALVYEMVSGRKAFEGMSNAEVMASILEREPPALSTLQPTSPPALDHLIRTCLAKDPEERWQSASDIRRDLAWLLGEGSTPVASVAANRRPARMGVRRVLPLAAAAVVGGLVVGLGAVLLKPAPSPDSRPVSRFDHELPEGQEFRNAHRPVMAFSADGSAFVYNTTKGLYLRSLRESDARLIPGTEEDLSGPFFSPDGQWLGFFSDGQLKKIAVAGGTPIPLCDAEQPYGAHWGSDGTIVFGQSRGIMRVSAAGGAPTLIASAKTGEQLDGPELLPGGRWVLFSAARVQEIDQSDRVDSVVLGRWNQASIEAQSLDSGERKLLWSGGSDPSYVPTGHLVFARGDDLFALAFDPGSMTVSGKPARVLAGVQRPVKRRGTIETGFASHGFSRGGTLVYVPREDVTRERVPALVERAGGAQPLDVPPAPFVNPRLSPDGRRVAIQTLEEDGRGEIWVYDLSGKNRIRQLTAGGNSWYPLWTPDSRHVTFVSDRDGTRSIYRQLADGSAVAERLTTAAAGASQRPDSWSPDGAILAYRVYMGDGDAGIWMLTPGAGSEPKLFHDVPGSDQYESVFSPDGRWLAYASDESGEDEVYILPFPGPGPPVRLTREGGGHPMWSPDGRQVFYRRSFHRHLSRSQGARLFSMPITARGGVEFGAERMLPLEGFLVFNTYKDYDITADGKRFLLIVPVAGAMRPPRISVVQNWFEELKARVPVP
jgi:Tol biopolymer transport system component/predicted Ser/Thr protein kinase